MIISRLVCGLKIKKGKNSSANAINGEIICDKECNNPLINGSRNK
jgi:hypothetical protein